MKCANCNQEFKKDQLKIIDDQPICVKCLFNDANPLTIWPIGYVVNDKERSDSAFGTTGREISKIHLYPGMTGFMKGLSDETYLTIIWQTHRPRAIRSVFKRGWDGKKVGPFASRTPDRLTPIAISEVKLLEVKGTTLVVSDLDAINGTPVLDIKISHKSLK